MIKRLVMPLLATIIIVAMVIPGCGDPTAGPFALETAVSPAGAGTASFTGTSPFEANAEVPVQATASAGWAFDRWTATAGFFANAGSASTTFTMPNRAATITANFKAVRTDGFWLDRIYIEKEGDRAKAIERLAAGDFDVYAHTLTDKALFEIVDDDPNLWFKSSIGSFNTLRLNCYGPEFDDGMVNPFYQFDFPEGVRTMNEVMNKWVSREFIANDIMGGLAWPRYTSQHTQLSDYARYSDTISALEELYEYDEAEGLLWLNETMAAINDLAPGDITGSAAGGWLYNGEPIRMIIAIRSDDPVRDAIGDLMVSQLRKMGFDATAFKGNMAATLSGKANVRTEITGGGWSIYTGGWVSTVLSRDSGYWFLYFHTGFWSGGIPAFADLIVPDEYFDAAMALAWLDFGSFAERDALYELCLPEHMKYGMIHLVDSRGFSPLSQDVNLAADRAGGIYGSWMWALTAHFRGSDPQFGGQMNVAMHDLLVEPWNPVAGSNTVYDMFPIRATGDMGTHPDVNTGLRWAGRITNAEVTVTTGLPVIATNPWVTLSFADTITAPNDAWRAWDWETQSVVTVADALAAPDAEWGLASAGVASYSVAYYPADIWDHPLHDGSTLSYADFLYGWIVGYDRGQGEGVNPMYDAAAASTLTRSTYPNTVGMKFTVNPSAGVGLKVETWSQSWELDAERMIGTGYPNYTQGNGFWHQIALGIRGERDGDMAFGETKAQPTTLGWINFLNRDVQQGQLISYLDGIRAATTYTDAILPYYEFINARYGASGLGSFNAEIAPRMDNLKAFAGDVNHLWVGSGPYYLEDYSFALKWVRLAPFEAYPDARDRWLFLLDGQ
jgi:peptide/nickel transport system substrate-binding protein